MTLSLLRTKSGFVSYCRLLGKVRLLPPVSLGGSGLFKTQPRARFLHSHLQGLASAFSWFGRTQLVTFKVRWGLQLRISRPRAFSRLGRYNNHGILVTVFIEFLWPLQQCILLIKVLKSWSIRSHFKFIAFKLIRQKHICLEKNYLIIGNTQKASNGIH